MKLSRILVALDVSPEAQAGLKSAVELAGRAGARLSAVYIEDENWYQATQTSIVRHVSRHTGETIKVNEKEIARQSKAVKTRLEHQVTQISQEWKVEYNCRSYRGQIDQELINASEDAELVVIGRRGSSFHTKDELGSTARYLVDNCSSPVLIWSAFGKWPAQFYGISGDENSYAAVSEWVMFLSRLLHKDVRMIHLHDHQVQTGEEIKIQKVQHAHDIYQWSGSGLVVINRKDELFKEVDLHHFVASMYNPVLLL